jgi:hypothetical protein
MSALDRPIFIGGTGRSGTTILKRVLGRHPAVYAIPLESRFLVDTDGLLDLVDALSLRWRAANTDKALRRFESLMRRLRRVHPSWRVMHFLQRATRRDASVLLSPAPYAQHDLGRHLGLEHYDRTVARFLEQIEGFRFRGRWPGTRGFRLRPEVRYGARFERDQLLTLARDFVGRLLQPAVARAGKIRWCDDTPGNLLASDFLLELFPDMKLVHIHRDPRDVLASAIRQRWAPAATASAIDRLKWILEQWRPKRSALPASCFLEIDFGALVSDRRSTLEQLCGFLDLPFDDALLEVPLDRPNLGRYTRDLTRADVQRVEQELGPWMHEFGYRTAGGG